MKCNGLFKRGRAKTSFGTQESFEKAQHHIRIWIDGKRVYLHRYLVEKYVRPLEKGEIVHHKDENKFNNSLDNLEILSGHAAHLHRHDYYRKRRAGRAQESAEDWQKFGW